MLCVILSRGALHVCDQDLQHLYDVSSLWYLQGSKWLATPQHFQITFARLIKLLVFDPVPAAHFPGAKWYMRLVHCKFAAKVLDIELASVGLEAACRVVWCQPLPSSCRTVITHVCHMPLDRHLGEQNFPMGSSAL